MRESRRVWMSLRLGFGGHGPGLGFLSSTSFWVELVIYTSFSAGYPGCKVGVFFCCSLDNYSAVTGVFSFTVLFISFSSTSCMVPAN
jgi:hypothetical protein